MSFFTIVESITVFDFTSLLVFLINLFPATSSECVLSPSDIIRLCSISSALVVDDDRTRLFLFEFNNCREKNSPFSKLSKFDILLSLFPKNWDGFTFTCLLYDTGDEGLLLDILLSSWKDFIGHI